MLNKILTDMVELYEKYKAEMQEIGRGVDVAGFCASYENEIVKYFEDDSLQDCIEVMPKVPCQACKRPLNAYENIFTQIEPGPPPKIKITLHCPCGFKLTKEFPVSVMMRENKFDENDLPF